MARGITDIGTAATAPALTAPDRKPEYDGFVRTVFSDLDQGKADANWIYDKLGAKTVVAIHDGSPYAQQLAAVMAKNFEALGGKVLSTEAVAPTDVDMHPVLTRIATEKPDAIYLPIFVAAAAQIVRQAPTIPGLEKTPLIGGGALMAPEFIQAVGPGIVGLPHHLSGRVAGFDGQGLSQDGGRVQANVRRGADLRLSRQFL